MLTLGGGGQSGCRRFSWDNVISDCLQGYAWHVVSTASEWTMVAGMLVFFATFIQEFRTLALRGLSIEIMIDNPPVRSRGEYQSVDDG